MTTLTTIMICSDCIHHHPNLVVSCIDQFFHFIDPTEIHQPHLLLRLTASECLRELDLNYPALLSMRIDQIFSWAQEEIAYIKQSLIALFSSIMVSTLGWISKNFQIIEDQLEPLQLEKSFENKSYPLESRVMFSCKTPTSWINLVLDKHKPSSNRLNEISSTSSWSQVIFNDKNLGLLTDLVFGYRRMRSHESLDMTANTPASYTSSYSSRIDPYLSTSIGTNSNSSSTFQTSTMSQDFNSSYPTIKLLLPSLSKVSSIHPNKSILSHFTLSKHLDQSSSYLGSTKTTSDWIDPHFQINLHLWPHPLLELFQDDIRLSVIFILENLSMINSMDSIRLATQVVYLIHQSRIQSEFLEELDKNGEHKYDHPSRSVPESNNWTISPCVLIPVCLSALKSYSFSRWCVASILLSAIPGKIWQKDIYDTPYSMKTLKSSHWSGMLSSIQPYRPSLTDIERDVNYITKQLRDNLLMLYEPQFDHLPQAWRSLFLDWLIQRPIDFSLVNGLEFGLMPSFGMWSQSRTGPTLEKMLYPYRHSLHPAHFDNLDTKYTKLAYLVYFYNPTEIPPQSPSQDHTTQNDPLYLVDFIESVPTRTLIYYFKSYWDEMMLINEEGDIFRFLKLLIRYLLRFSGQFFDVVCPWLMQIIQRRPDLIHYLYLIIEQLEPIAHLDTAQLHYQDHCNSKDDQIDLAIDSTRDIHLDSRVSRFWKRFILSLVNFFVHLPYPKLFYYMELISFFLELNNLPISLVHIILDLITNNLRHCSSRLLQDWTFGRTLIEMVHHLLIHRSTDIRSIFSTIIRLLSCIKSEFGDIEIRDEARFYLQLMIHVQIDKIQEILEGIKLDPISGNLQEQDLDHIGFNPGDFHILEELYLDWQVKKEDDPIVNFQRIYDQLDREASLPQMEIGKINGEIANQQSTRLGLKKIFHFNLNSLIYLKSVNSGVDSLVNDVTNKGHFNTHQERISLERDGQATSCPPQSSLKPIETCWSRQLHAMKLATEDDTFLVYKSILSWLVLEDATNDNLGEHPSDQDLNWNQDHLDLLFSTFHSKNHLSFIKGLSTIRIPILAQAKVSNDIIKTHIDDREVEVPQTSLTFYAVSIEFQAPCADIYRFDQISIPFLVIASQDSTAHSNILTGQFLSSSPNSTSREELTGSLHQKTLTELKISPTDLVAQSNCSSLGQDHQTSSGISLPPDQFPMHYDFMLRINTMFPTPTILQSKATYNLYQDAQIIEQIIDPPLSITFNNLFLPVPILIHGIKESFSHSIYLSTLFEYMWKYLEQLNNHQMANQDLQAKLRWEDPMKAIDDWLTDNSMASVKQVLKGKHVVLEQLEHYFAPFVLKEKGIAESTPMESIGNDCTTVSHRRVFIFLPKRYHLLMRFKIRREYTIIKIQTDWWRGLPHIDQYLETCFGNGCTS